MAPKLPFQIIPGDASRGSVVHASDADLADLSRSHSEEAISRLQSAANDYSASLTYEVGDLARESGIVYYCINQITVPETFNPSNWEDVGFPQTPWTSDIDADAFSLSNTPTTTYNEISEPSDPAANKAIMWFEEFLGSSVLRYKTLTSGTQTLTQDTVILGRNVTGVTIAKGQAVYIDGADSGIPSIKLAQADSLTTTPGFGVAPDNIPNNTNSLILVSGSLVDTDTSLFSVGDLLYLSATTPGALTNVAPTHPNLTQIMGTVLVSDAVNGNTAVFIGQITGRESGTLDNSFIIGDTLAGTKTLSFTNNFTGNLEWTPTANHTLTLPDTSDTLIGRNTTDALTSKTMSGFSNTFTDVSGFTGLGVQAQILNMGNHRIEAVVNPQTGQDAATKAYVDNLVQGLQIKEAAVVATTGNITLSGNQTIDDVLTQTGDRVLVKDQTSAQFNGLYNTAVGSWTRTTDADTDLELVNMSVFIEQGTTNAGSTWVLITPLPIIVDTTPLIYAQTSAGNVSPLTTKGDIYGFDTGDARIPVGTDGQVLTSSSGDSLGVTWTDVFLTPWNSDIDADNFDLKNLSNIEFGLTTGAPSGTTPAIWQDGVGLNINQPTGGIVEFLHNGGLSLSIQETNIQMNGTFLDNVSFINSNNANPSSVGFLRLGANEFVSSRNVGNTTDIQLVGIEATGDTLVSGETGQDINFRIGGTDIAILSEFIINTPTGVFQEAGIPISPIGTHDIWLDAGSFVPISSGSVSSRVVGSGDNQKGFHYIAFETNVNTSSVVKFTLPRNYNNGTFTAVIKWTSQIEDSGNVVWGIAGVALDDGDNMTDGATNFGTEVTVTDAQQTINDIQITSRSTAMTLANTPNDSDTIFLRVRRLGTSGSDTFPEDAQLLGLYLEFSTDGATST